MRKVKRWRFYCDFCSKASMRAFTTQKHETGCTKNPNRKCGVCQNYGNEQLPIEQLKAVVQEYGDGCIKPLREITNGCPACILAALRQYNQGLPVEDYVWTDFDFRAEMKEHWNNVNEENMAHGHPY